MNEKKTLLGLKHFILFFKCLNASNFRAFSFFGSHIFCAEKKSIRDMVILWHLKTAQTILVLYEIINLAISCIV